MKRGLVTASFLMALPVLVCLAQPNLGGAWVVTLTAPLGDVNFRMFLVQKEARLSGYMLSEVGQFEIVGAVNGNQVEFSWTFPDGGKIVPIHFTGKLQGGVISGIAKVGTLGEGPLVAERP